MTMSEDNTNESRRLAVESKIFQKLDKRREDKSARYAQRAIEREEQNAELNSVLSELDGTVAKMTNAISAKSESEIKTDDIVGNTEFLDNLVSDMQKLENYFAEKSNYLAAYDVKRIQNSILEIKSRFQELQDLMQPKKKFGFKGNKKKQTTSSTVQAKVEPQKNVSYHCEGFHITDKEGETIEIKGIDNINGDVLISKLKRCTVKMLCSPSTVHITDLEDCTVLSGPVNTSVFVERCRRCTFVVACQQLRTHETTESDFYLHVTSKGIIEDCNNVRFAPYNLEYEKLADDFITSGLNPKVNNWNSIDDFNWLASDEHSPHWEILPEGDRKKFEV